MYFFFTVVFIVCNLPFCLYQTECTHRIGNKDQLRLSRTVYPFTLNVVLVNKY